MEVNVHPSQFWFCRNPGLALPLIALQYHEVKINVEFNPTVSWTHTQDANSTLTPALTVNTAGGVPMETNAAFTYDDGSGVGGAAGNDVTINANSVVLITDGTTTTSMSITNCCVYCDYIFLDTDERRRFAQVSHEYLIEQLQYSNVLTLIKDLTKSN